MPFTVSPSKNVKDSDVELVHSVKLLSQLPLRAGLKIKDTTMSSSTKPNTTDRRYDSEFDLAPIKKMHVKSPTSSLNETMSPYTNGESDASGGVATMDEENYSLKFFVHPCATHKGTQSFVSMLMPPGRSCGQGESMNHHHLFD